MNKVVFVALFFLMSLATVKAFATDDEHFLSVIEKQLNSSIEDKVLLSSEKQQLENRVKEIQDKIKNSKKHVLKRLRSLYSLKQYQWAELFLNSNLNELDRNIKILKNLNQYDLALFKEYNASLRLLALARKNLQETEAQIEKNVETLKKQQKQFLTLEKLRIESLLKNQKDSLLIHKGLLSRPLDGDAKYEFGSIRDRDNQFYLINRGELYITKALASVKSVGPGTIIFSDELARWRETLIIQHADNYYSVYAGIKSIKKSVGEQVARGEFIGVTAGENFYFELRHFDNPINPRSWYRSKHE